MLADDRPETRFARIGLWLIPVYGALLALGTITRQPDYDTDFQGYAEYITTDRFLVSHLGASIAGAALGLLGIVAALAFLVAAVPLPRPSSALRASSSRTRSSPPSLASPRSPSPRSATPSSTACLASAS